MKGIKKIIRKNKLCLVNLVSNINLYINRILSIICSILFEKARRIFTNIIGRDI